ncbi:MAG: hypothetical protein ABGZ53_30840 [Fuerstiella sp.]
MSRYFQCFLAAIALLLVHSGVTHAVSPVDDGVTRLAEAVSDFFERERHEKIVFVGAVTSPAGDGDAALRQKLVTALEAEDFLIRRAKLSINGRFSKEFRPEGTSGPNRVALRLKAEIRDRESDGLIQPISIPIFGEEAITHLNPTVELAADLPENKRHEKLNDAIDNPSAAIDGNVVKAARDSKFGIEVLVRRGSSSSSREPTDDLGFAFVTLSKGEEYIVRLHNNATFETAVSLNIDGLSMFSFSKEGNFGSQVIVAAGSFVNIPGWYINSAKTDVFEITSYAKSAAATKSIPMASTGTITASFHRSYEASPKDADTATGLGRRIDQKYETVKRVVGKQRAIVTVRYHR